MFYTLVSRTIITKIDNPRDYLYIFVIGSVGYVVLHWYLHMEKREGIIERVRGYIYYAMVLDAIVAYVMMIMYPPKKKVNPNINDKNNVERPQQQFTAEQKKVLLQRMQEARKMQQLYQKEQEKQEDIKEEKIIKESKNENGENNNEGDGCKKSIFTKSEESLDEKESNHTDKKTNVKLNNKVKNTTCPEIEDTEIPLFEEDKNDKKKDEQLD